MDRLGLGFTLLLLVGIIGWAGLLHFFFEPYVKNRRKRRERQAETREVDGPITSLAEYVTERDERVQRARWRHQRYGRSA